jgi:hypothetical protein
MTHPSDGNTYAIERELEEQEAHDAEVEAEEHPCCFCNDEGSIDGTGEVHPCAFCGAC